MNKPVFLSGNNAFDVLGHIQNVVRTSATDPVMIEIAKEVADLAPKQQILTVANFLLKTVYYQPDPPNLQQIKTPNRLLRDGRGNCVHYTIFLATIAKILELPVQLKLVSFDNKNFTHIYPVINGWPVDIVPQQEQTGIEHLSRANGIMWDFEPEVPSINSFVETLK